MSSVMDKIKIIISSAKKYLSGRSQYGYSSRPSLTTMTSDAMIVFFEKYKGIRRIILIVVMYVNLRIFFTTTEMYKLTGGIDTQWVIYAGYWTAILGTFISFYTLARTREFNSETPYSRKGEWINQSNSNNDNSTFNATYYNKDDTPSLYNDSVPEDKNN